MMMNSSKSGLEMFFGKNEVEILKYLWEKKSASAKEIEFYFHYLDKPIHFNTVVTTLHRMVNKNILNKTKRLKSWEFFPRETKRSLMRQIDSEIKSLNISWKEIINSLN